MSVFRRGRFMAVRWAIGLGVLLAFPFLASGVAQAAMAGANPLTTTNRPDLRTVHVSSAADTGEFCFDKTIANTGPQGGVLDATKFMLGGYRFDTAVAGLSVGVDTSNTDCAQVGFSRPDLSQYTFGTVADNAVIFNGGGNGALGNIGDSTADLDSAGHSGTADHTTGPDLTSVLVDNTNNRLIYNFDKSVGSISAGTDQRFLFYDSNGKAHYAEFVVGTRREQRRCAVRRHGRGFGQPRPPGGRDPRRSGHGGPADGDQQRLHQHQRQCSVRRL